MVTRQQVPAGAPPAEVDRLVREQLEAGESLYTLDIELLARLKPDLILTQDLCRVCSIDLGTVRRATSMIETDSGPPRLLSLNPHTIEDVLEDLLNVGRATDLARESDQAMLKLRERMFRAMEHVNPYLEGPNVAFLEWTDPLFAPGHWTPQLIERAGGRHPLNPTAPAEGSGTGSGMQSAASKAGPSRRVSIDELVQSGPSAVIVCPCGVALDPAMEMTKELTRCDWWGDLPGVRAGRVAVIDGNRMFSRPGPRLIDGLEFLVGWLNGVESLIPSDFPWRPWR